MRRTGALLVAAALALGTQLTPAAAETDPGAQALPAAAQARDCATSVVSSSMSPSKISVGTTQAQTSTFTVVLDNTCVSPVVSVIVASTGVVVSRDVPMSQTAQVGNRVTFSGSTSWNPADFDNEQYQGTWISVIDTSSDDGASLSAPGAGFSVLRAARLEVKSSPSKLAKGSKLSVVGRLQRADWDGNKYGAYAGRLVRLQFQPSGGAYANVDTARSMSRGGLFNSVTVVSDGCYRYVFAGSSSTSSATAAVPTCIDVT